MLDLKDISSSILLKRLLPVKGQGLIIKFNELQKYKASSGVLFLFQNKRMRGGGLAKRTKSEP